MIVACPSCGARFNLDPAKLLPAGRNVRCAKCDHRWRQMPEGAEAPAELAESPEAAAQAPTEPPGPPPEPLDEAMAEAMGDPGAEAPAAPPPPDEAESHPPRPPETPAEMAQSLAAIAEQVAGAHMGPTGGEGYTVTEGAPQIAPNPISRLARRGAPGPITVPPRMRPMRPAKRSSNLGIILLAGCVIGLLVAGYVFRDVIARTVPGTDAIYALLGLSADNPAAYLDISVDDFGLSTDQKTGQKVFELKATVFNKSYNPVNMPALMIVPVDDAGSQLEPLRFRLEELVVAPGQNIKFQKSFDNWPPTAPNFEIRLADAP